MFTESQLTFWHIGIWGIRRLDQKKISVYSSKCIIRISTKTFFSSISTFLRAAEFFKISIFFYPNFKYLPEIQFWTGFHFFKIKNTWNFNYFWKMSMVSSTLFSAIAFSDNTSSILKILSVNPMLNFKTDGLPINIFEKNWQKF